MAINRVNLEDVINDAKAALEAGNPDRAIALCHHIFKFYPRCLEASRMLGEAYTEQRHFDEAEQLFTFVLSADPQDVLGYVDRGFIAYEQGRLDDAILYCERALELDPSIEQLREELLRLYRERQPSVRAQIRMTKVGLANGRLRDGLYGQAIEEYNNVLRQTPHRLDVQVGLMEAYWRNRDYNRAEQQAQELIENNSYLVKANLILWHIYGVRRNQERAAEYVERAHALDPLNLLAERLFEDPAASSEAMNYISMLGVPNIPGPDYENLTVDAGQKKFVPEWAANRQETDVVLGLRPDLPSASAKDENNSLGLDLFALLSDTERHVAEQQEEEAARPAAPQEQTALNDLDELRQEDDPFSLFEEVESPAEPETALPPQADSQSASTASGAFDLDFSLGKEGDLSLFEEVATDDRSAQTQLEPFAFEPELAAAATAPDAAKNPTPDELVPFDFDEDAEPPEFLRDIPPFDFNQETTSKDQAKSFDMAESSDDSAVLPVLEPFNFDEVLNSAVEEVPAPGSARTIQPTYKFEDLEASDSGLEPFRFSDEGEEGPTSSNDSFQPVEPEEAPGLPLEPEKEPHPTPIPTTPVVPSPDAPREEPGEAPAFEPEPPGLPETEPGADRGEPLPMFESQEAGSFAGFAAAAEQAKETAQPAFEVYREPYAFYKRDEQGPVPDFALEQMAQDSSVAAFSGLDDIEPATEAAAPNPRPGVITEPLTTPPNQLQENSEMPIRRGMENDTDLFDWEREELPDYLKAFALDENEIEQAGLSDGSPSITDVNTPPARIRSREDTGPTNFGDLPPWLLPEEPAAPPPPPQSVPPQNGNDDTGSIDRLGLMTSALPSWLDTPTSEYGQPSNQASQAGFESTDFDNLAPFDLDDDDFGTEPAPAPPTPFTVNQPTSQPPVGFTPADDLEPFSLDDELTGFEPPAPPAPIRPNVPPPPPTPAFDLGLDDDDLAPFSFEEFDAAVPAPPVPTQAQMPHEAAPPAPPVFAGQDDFGDLLPFNLEDEGEMPPPPPVNHQPSVADQFRPTQSPAGFDDSGLEAIQPFSIDDFDLPAPPPPPAGTGQLTPPAPIRSEFDFEPFSWHTEDDNIFGDQGPDLGPDTHNPFAALNQSAYASPAPPAPQPEADDTDEEKPLRQFEWVRQRAPEPEKTSDQEGMSLFDKLAARRQQQEAAQPQEQVTRPASTGPAEITDDDLLPLEELEARAARQATTAESAPESEAATESTTEAAPESVEDELVTPEATVAPEYAEEAAPNEAEEAAQPAEVAPTDAEAVSVELPPLWYDEPETESEPEAATQVFEREGVTERLSSGDETVAEPAEEVADPIEDIPTVEAIQPEEETSAQEAASEEAATEQPVEQPVDAAVESVEQTFHPAAIEASDEKFEEAAEEAAKELAAEPEKDSNDTADAFLAEAGIETAELDASATANTFESEADTEPAEAAFEAVSEPAEAASEPAQAEDTPEAEPELVEAATEAESETVEAAPESESAETASEAAPEVTEFAPEPEQTQPVQEETESEPEAAVEATSAEFAPAYEPGEATSAAEPSENATETAAVESPAAPEAVPAEVSEAAVGAAPTVEPTAEPTDEPATEAAAEPVVAPPVPRSPKEETLDRANQSFTQQDYNQSLTYFNQAVRAADKADLPEIVASLKEITGSAGVNARFHRILGDAYKKQGQFQAALAEYSKALGPATGKK